MGLKAQSPNRRRMRVLSPFVRWHHTQRAVQSATADLLVSFVTAQVILQLGSNIHCLGKITVVLTHYVCH